MTKVKQHLSNASIEIAKAVYYSCGSMETRDENELRYVLELIPAIIGRIEKNEKIYPCADCGKMRSEAEGGTVFTVCDECWDKHYTKSTPA